MTRLARLAVALLAGAAVLVPVAGQGLPRGHFPVPEASPAVTSPWAAPMSRSEPPRRPCNRAGRWTRAEVRCAIRRAFPDHAQRMALCVAWRESRYLPHVTGRAGERGLFQIHPVHRAWLGRRWAHLYEPAANARAARDLQRRAGWGPWTTAGACR